ncbi:MAG: hypothetical protein J0M15_14405 [Deltaproteobacteria bacterium]|nr:hypothetical protein [Deltaproteobacteria bacterium]
MLRFTLLFLVFSIKAFSLLLSEPIQLAENAIVIDESTLIAKPKSPSESKSKTQTQSQTKSQAKPKSLTKPQTQPVAKSNTAKKAQPKALKMNEGLTFSDESPQIPPLSEEETNSPVKVPPPVSSAPPQSLNPKKQKIRPPLVLDESSGREEPKNPMEVAPTANSSNTGHSTVSKSKFKDRKAITIDYNTWYETIKILNSSTSAYSDTKSHYFGVGIYYDHTIYEEKYGYAFSLGAISGNAQSGIVNTGEYYERRISWLGYRVGGRFFVRANTRIDIGPSILVQFKDTKWPEEATFKVMPQINPQYFFFLDTRWRISYPLELVQSFGFHTRQYSMIWRLGFNYTLN